MIWSTEEKDAVVKALTVVCETTQTVWTQASQDVVLLRLGAYSAAQVVAALDLCLNQVKFKLSYADIASRIDDGRPGAEEAWSLMPKDEKESGCVTREMSEAWGAAASLFSLGDKVGARMAFKEKYQLAVAANRAAGDPPKWSLSPGWDRAGREAAAQEGLKSGRLSEKQASHYVLPPNATPNATQRMAGLLKHWTEPKEDEA